MANLLIRIDLGGEAALGPGKAQLLELIDEKGSIRAAAAAMDMSYRRAWLLLQETEAIMGAPVVVTETGGARGGGARLTALGRDVIRRYRAIERRAGQAAAPELRALSRLASGKRKP
jgi:molybdate transport system regulatory protein